MKLYKQFHSLKTEAFQLQNTCFEFHNLSIKEDGSNKSNEQMSCYYLAGLNSSIRDEMVVVYLFNLEDSSIRDEMVVVYLLNLEDVLHMP